MPSRRKKVVPFRYWESSKVDGIEKRYIRLGNSQMLSKAMLGLSNAAFRVYICMRLEAGDKPEFEYPYRKYKIYMSRPTFGKAVEELETAGFIKLVSSGKNTRQPNIYRFIDGWKTYNPDP